MIFDTCKKIIKIKRVAYAARFIIKNTLPDFYICLQISVVVFNLFME